jgi:hypothetical protein
MHRDAALYPQDDSWYLFLLEDELSPGSIVLLEELGRLGKNSMISQGLNRDL